VSNSVLNDNIDWTMILSRLALLLLTIK